MYLKRKIDSFLQNWKADEAHRPLMVHGSRQVGKPEAINHFARQNDESTVEINFIRDEKYKGISADGYEGLPSSKTSLIDPANQFIPGKRCFSLTRSP